MANSVTWNLQLSVREGRLGETRVLAAEMVDCARQEAGTQAYEWDLSDDGAACHVNERYADSDAALVHLGTFGSKFAKRFLECFEPTAFSVYGEPTDEARAALDGLGAVYFGTLEGFTR